MDLIGRVTCGLLASLSFIMPIDTTNVVAASTSCLTEPCVLADIHLGTNLKVLKTVVWRPYAYILAESPDKWLWLYQALSRDNGHWMNVAGAGTPIVDRPRAFFFPRRANLEYTLSRPHGSLGNKEYQFDWCLFGYTTDSQVTQFRIKTKTGYIPLETIHNHYFIRVLSESERERLVEVQGLNSKGLVIQRDDGLEADKPREWSPRHSELY